MQTELLFASTHHSEYLRARLEAKGTARGLKTRFAEYLRIQPAYLSQVLSKKHALSLEQADLANQFFDHTSDEADFFLLLVSRDRAGSHSLKDHFQKKISSALLKRKQVVQRIGSKKDVVSEEAKGVYYSSWMYAAIHVGCTVPALRTRKALAEYLNLPLPAVARVLEFLMENQLIRKENDLYQTTESWLRIDRQSPHIVKHHANWRQKAIQNLDVQNDDELHYSGVFSMDAQTAHDIKNTFLGSLKSELKKVEGAREEDLYSIGIDLFQLAKK